MLANALTRAWLTARVKRNLDARDYAAAEGLARKLLAKHPDSRDGYLYLYDALFDDGRIGDALSVAEQALSRGIDDSQIWNRKGLACLRLGQLDIAEHAFSKAIEHDKSSPAPYVNLSSIALRRNDTVKAMSWLDTVLAAHPQHGGARVNRALIHISTGNRSAAEHDLRAVLAQEPAHKAALDNLVQLLIDEERLDDAADLAWTGLERTPNDAALLLALGRIAVLRGAFNEAEKLARQLQSLNVSDPDVKLGVAVLLRDTKHYPACETLLRELLADSPNEPLTHFNLSFLLLLQGRFAEGWPEYEYRKLTAESPGNCVTAPQWGGEPIDGRLLIYAEQGIGDEIMFASCIPDVMQRVNDCVVQCDPRLAPLLQRTFDQTKILGVQRSEREQALSALGSFKAQVPMGSLPLLFRSKTSAFPKRDGYLHADAAEADKFRRQLKGVGPEPKIGLCWQGGLVKTRQVSRSIGLGMLVDALPPAVLVSLQHGKAGENVEHLLGQSGRHLHCPVAPHNNIDQLASLISALDVVISVQSTVVHLCGALGVKCYALIPYSPEWRYLAEGDTMPWYSSVTLLRQSIPGDWSAPLARLRQLL